MNNQYTDAATNLIMFVMANGWTNVSIQYVEKALSYAYQQGASSNAVVSVAADAPAVDNAAAPAEPVANDEPVADSEDAAPTTRKRG